MYIYPGVTLTVFFALLTKCCTWNFEVIIQGIFFLGLKRQTTFFSTIKPKQRTILKKHYSVQTLEIQNSSSCNYQTEGAEDGDVWREIL